MKKGLVSQETDQSFSITGRNPHEEPSNQPLMNAPHEERPSTSLITQKNADKRENRWSQIISGSDLIDTI